MPSAYDQETGEDTMGIWRELSVKGLEIVEEGGGKWGEGGGPSPLDRI